MGESDFLSRFQLGISEMAFALQKTSDKLQILEQDLKYVKENAESLAKDDIAQIADAVIKLSRYVRAVSDYLA
jgi:hypothetical protein